MDKSNNPIIQTPKDAGPPLTFVTSFVKIYDTDVHNKTVQWRIDRFCEIAALGIHICVYVSLSYTDLFIDILRKYPNVRMMKCVDICDTEIYKTYHAEGIEYSYPEHKNQDKDVEGYMMLMHAKTEFLKDAIDRNIWNSTHFSWIDFNISHIFKYHFNDTLNYLKFLSSQHFVDNFFTIPGCTDKMDLNNMYIWLNNVQWRFCGGFIVGDKQSLIDFYQVCKDRMSEFIALHKKLVWEVNYWAWLESSGYISPRWYAADHNDSMIYIPADLYAMCLKNDATYDSKTYRYPTVDSPDVRYFPSSAAYLRHNDQNYLNTRYVSYTLFPSGTYFFTILNSENGDRNKIYNKNVLSKLDDNFEMLDYIEMDENIDIPKQVAFSEGLEDMRLYECDGKVKFVASNINYSGVGKVRVMNGTYNLDTHTYSDCHIIRPPSETHCEKNWIPIIHKGEEKFIYKWYPFELGKIDNNHQLQICQTNFIMGACFEKIRGSTIFYEVEQGYLGVVHFCEEGAPRHYYNHLMLLNKETLVPEKYSHPFYFNNVSIEFCVGFAIKDGRYHFWISQMDGNPAMISVDIASIPLIYDVIRQT